MTMKIVALFQNRLAEISSIAIHHKETEACGTVTFHFENADAETAQVATENEGVELSVQSASVANVTNLI